MERELGLLRQKAGAVSPRDLEPLMAATGGSLPDGRIPEAIEFAPGELRLRGVALAPDEESVFNTRLQAAGYRARTEDSTLLVRTEVAP
jgi:general secretion pathway protein L